MSNLRMAEPHGQEEGLCGIHKAGRHGMGQFVRPGVTAEVVAPRVAQAGVSLIVHQIDASKAELRELISATRGHTILPRPKLVHVNHLTNARLRLMKPVGVRRYMGQINRST